MSSSTESTTASASRSDTPESNAQSSRSNMSRNGRNRHKKATKERNGLGSSNTIPANKVSPKRKGGSSDKFKGESKDFRFLEVLKLVRKHLPITINGYSSAKVIESHIALQNSGSERQDEAIGNLKVLSKKDKEAILIGHIQNVTRKDPQQPLYLSFIMKPADPDFPFELDLLNFSLTIPAEYPRSSRALPSIVVLNTEIPRGFSVNIERGFRTIVTTARTPRGVVAPDEEKIKLVDGKGLLSQVQTLNKYLEVFLQQEKRQTVKFITFKGTAKSSNEPKLTSSSGHPEQQKRIDLAAVALEENPANVSEATRLKREYYVEEMTQKLGHAVKLFNRGKAEARYKVQIPIRTSKDLPKLWIYGNKTVDIFLTVPTSYPETPLRAMVASNFSSNLLVAKKNALISDGKDLISVVEEARTAEKNFNKNMSHHARQHTKSLVQYLNWASNQLNTLIKPTDEYNNRVLLMNSLKVA